MTLGRFSGTFFLNRYGRATVVRASAISGAIGLSLVIFSDNAVVAAAAVLFWGLGASLGFPVALSAAPGDSGPDQTARVDLVATIGYIRLLGGPARSRLPGRPLRIAFGDGGGAGVRRHGRLRGPCRRRLFSRARSAAVRLIGQAGATGMTDRPIGRTRSTTGLSPPGLRRYPTGLSLPRPLTRSGTASGCRRPGVRGRRWAAAGSVRCDRSRPVREPGCHVGPGHRVPRRVALRAVRHPRGE